MSGRRAKRQRRDQTGSVNELNHHLKHDPIGQPSLTARPEVVSAVSYIMEPVFETTDPRYGKSNHGRGSQGVYEATYILAIPGRNIAQTDINFEALLEEGDSLLRVPDEVSKIDIQISNNSDHENNIAQIEVGINQFHRIKYVRFQVSAGSFNEASKAAHDIFMPILSRWSYQHNVPITTSAVELLELASESRKYDVVVLPATKDFGDMSGASSAEGRVLLAAFREGISTLEPLYQALCMFRVIEGCYTLRARRRRAQVESGSPFIDPGERLEIDQITVKNPRAQHNAEAAFGPYAGKKFTKLRDDFKQNIRHAIAHLDLEGDPLAADNYDDLLKVKQALPVMHHMARTLLTAELNP